ncbi:MAG: FHA domain-containing protein [Candidatus Omnitrophica bacterium]|nr:FHA domain-containing protein [Candidatus Omnitrophota bacterium]
MTSIVKQNKFRILFKTISLIVLACFFATVVIPSQALAQGVLGLPVPGTMVSLSPVFTPTILRGIRVYPNNSLKFDFIVDSGDTGLTGTALKNESEKLIKYFLAALTIPEDNLWVNLSPHEQDRIIPDILGSTDMGTDMLAQDYILKQITASLMNPDEKIGRQFWDRVYKKVYEEYGTIRHLKDGETSSNSQGEFDRANIPVDTFNKVWIMPEKAEVYVQEDRAFVVESKLKVMLETDYVALQAKQQVFSEEYLVYGDNQQPNTISQIPNTQNDFSKEIIREIIIPALEKEVNTGKNFAKLRQIYNSLILAYWFKHNLKESIINKVYSDQSKIRGVDVKDVSQDIYNQYVDSFKKGVCDFIKVEYDQYAHKNIPRKYFSGGVSWVLDSTFNSVGKEIALEYIQENGLPKNDYKIEVVLNDVNTSLTEIPSFEEPNAISSSSSIEKMMMVDIMADLKEKAAKGALRLILFDLDNSFFWPNGYIGSEIQKEISIKILALNIFLSEILKIGKNSSKKIPNDDEIQELAEKSIKKAQRVVYTQGDKDEKNMADSGFLEMSDGLRREDLKELKGDATNSLKIRAFTARPKLKEKVTLHVLQSLGIINKKSKRQPGDHDKDKFIIDQVIFTSGEGKIKAEALKATIEPLQAKAAEEGNPIDATEIVFIDDKPVNTEAVANMNLGIRIIQVITRENVNHEKTSYLDFINFAEKVIEGTNEKKDGQAFWYLVNAYYAAKTSKEKREVEKKALVLLSNEKFREFQLEIANDDLRRIRKPKPITKIDIPKALQQKGYTLEKLERLINEKLDKSITFGEEIKPTGSSSLNEKSEAADDSAFNAETASSDIEEKQGDLSMGAEMSWEEIKGEYEKAILAQYEKKIKMYSKINSRDDLAFVKLPTVPSFSEKDELKKVLYSLLSYVAGEDIEGENFNPSEETKKALVQLIPHLVRIYQSATFAIPKSLEALQSLLALGSKNDMITTKNDFVAATAGCAKFAQGAGYVVDESLEAFESLFALGITSGMITTKDDFFAVLEECANSANNGIPKSYKALELFLTIGMVKGMITTKDDFAVVVAECVRLAHNVGGFFSLRALKTLQFLIAQGIEKGKVTKDNFVATISNLTPELTKLNQGAGSYVYISFDVLQSLFEENLSFNDYLNQLRKLGDNIESHYADYTKVLQEANLKLFMTLGEHKELGLTFFEESAINLEYINELRESSESFDLKKYQDKFKRYALKKEFFKNFATSGGKIHLDINPDDDKGQALRNLAPSIALRFQNHSWQNEKKCLELHLNPSISSLFGDLMTKNLIRLGLIKPLGLTAKDSKGNLKNIVLQESLQVDGLFTDNNTDDFKQEPKLLALALLEISTHFPSYTDYVPSDVATFGHLVPGGGKLYNENDSQKDDRIDLFQVAQISDEDINNPYGHLDSSRIKTAYAILGNGLLSQYKPESRKASLDKKLSPIIKEFITQIEQILTKAECYEAFSIKWTVDKWPQLKKLYEQIQSFRKTKEGKQYALEIRQAVFDAQAEILMAMFEDSLNRDVITEKNASVALDIFNEVLEDVLGGYQAIVGPEFFIQRIHELRVKAKEFSGTTAYKKASQQILKALDLENITAENQYSSAWGYAEAQLDQFFSTTKDSVDAFKQYLLGVQPEGNRAYKDTIKQEIVEHVENWMERDEPLGALEFLMLDLKDILEILVRFHSLSNIDAQSWYKEILEQLKMDVPEIKDLINESENLVFTREKTIEDIREVLKAYKVLEGKREEIIEAWEDLRLPSDILLAHVIGKLFEQDGRFIKKDLPKDPAGGDGVSLDGFGKGALKHQLKKGFLPTDGGSDGYWLEEGGASDVVQNDSKGPVVTPGEQEFLIETPIETAEHSDPAQTASSDIGDLKVFIYNKKTGKEIRMQDAEKFDQIEFFVVDDNDDPVGTVLLETDNFINHAGLSRKSLKKRINRGIIEESDTNNYLNIRNIEIDSQEYSYQVLRKMMESISDFMEKIGEERIVINKVFVSDQKVSKDLARYLNLNVNLSYSKDPRVNNRLEITFYPNKYKDGLYFQDFSNSLVKSHFSSKMKHLHSKRNSDFNFDQRRLNFGFWDHVLNDKTDFLLFVESGDLVGYAGYQKPFLKKVKQNNGFNLESFVLDKKYENDDNVFVMLDKIINQVKLQKIERLYFSFNDFYISPDTQAAVDVPNYSSQMLEVLNRYCNKRGYHLSDPDPYKMYYIDFSSLPDTPISQAKTVVSSNLDGIDPTTTASSDIKKQERNPGESNSTEISSSVIPVPENNYTKVLEEIEAAILLKSDIKKFLYFPKGAPRESFFVAVDGRSKLSSADYDLLINQLIAIKNILQSKPANQSFDEYFEQKKESMALIIDNITLKNNLLSLAIGNTADIVMNVDNSEILSQKGLSLWPKSRIYRKLAQASFDQVISDGYDEDGIANMGLENVENAKTTIIETESRIVSIETRPHRVLRAYTDENSEPIESMDDGEVVVENQKIDESAWFQNGYFPLNKTNSVMNILNKLYYGVFGEEAFGMGSKDRTEGNLDQATAQASAEQFYEQIREMDRQHTLPLEIVVHEWGAGDGYSAWIFFRALENLDREKGTHYLGRLRYYVMDYSERIIMFLRSSTRLGRYPEIFKFVQADALNPPKDLPKALLIRGNLILNSLPKEIIEVTFDGFKKLFLRGYVDMKPNEIVLDSLGHSYTIEDIKNFIKNEDIKSLKNFDRKIFNKIKWQEEYHEIPASELSDRGYLLSLQQQGFTGRISLDPGAARFIKTIHDNNLAKGGMMQFVDSGRMDIAINEKNYRLGELVRFSGALYMPVNYHFLKKTLGLNLRGRNQAVFAKKGFAKQINLRSVLDVLSSFEKFKKYFNKESFLKPFNEKISYLTQIVDEMEKEGGFREENFEPFIARLRERTSGLKRNLSDIIRPFEETKEYADNLGDAYLYWVFVSLRNERENLLKKQKVLLPKTFNQIGDEIYDHLNSFAFFLAIVGFSNGIAEIFQDIESFYSGLLVVDIAPKASAFKDRSLGISSHIPTIGDGVQAVSSQPFEIKEEMIGKIFHRVSTSNFAIDQPAPPGVSVYELNEDGRISISPVATQIIQDPQLGFVIRVGWGSFVLFELAPEEKGALLSLGHAVCTSLDIRARKNNKTVIGHVHLFPKENDFFGKKGPLYEQYKAVLQYLTDSSLGMTDIQIVLGAEKNAKGLPPIEEMTREAQELGIKVLAPISRNTSDSLSTITTPINVLFAYGNLMESTGIREWSGDSKTVDPEKIDEIASSDIFSISEERSYVILDAFDADHQTKTKVRIDKDLLAFFKLVEKILFMPVPTEVFLLTLKTGVHNDINYYKNKINDLKDEEKWWEEKGTKEIPVSKLKRRHATSLIKLIGMMNYLRDSDSSVKDFTENNIIDVLDLEDGNYFVLDGNHRSDLAGLSGLENITVRIFKIKETFDEIEELLDEISFQNQWLDHDGKLNKFSENFFSSIRKLKEVAEYFPEFVEYQVKEGSEGFDESVLTCRIPSSIDINDFEIDSAYHYLEWLADLLFEEMPEIKFNLRKGLNESVKEGIFQKGENGNIFKAINRFSQIGKISNEDPFNPRGGIDSNATTSSSDIKGGIDPADTASSTFEIGKQMGPLGHLIAGGESTGRSGRDTREVIKVDWENDEILNQIYKNAISHLDKSKADQDTLLYKLDYLESVYDAVDAAIRYDEYAFSDKAGEEVLIGETLEKGGVCRHMGILVASVLEKMIKEGYLRGKVYYVRGPGHGWAVYQAKSGSYRVFDIAQNYFGDVDKKYFSSHGMFETYHQAFERTVLPSIKSYQQADLQLNIKLTQRKSIEIEYSKPITIDLSGVEKLKISKNVDLEESDPLKEIANPRINFYITDEKGGYKALRDDESVILGREYLQDRFPQLNNKYISRMHITIVRQGDRIIIKDGNSRSSANGTYVTYYRQVQAEDLDSENYYTKFGVASSNLKGGIDFNAENMNVTTKGDEIDFDIPLDLQNITSSSIEGFVPIIINITPVTDFMGLLGLREDDLKENDEKEKHLSYVDDSFVEPMLCCQSMQVYDKKKS